MTDQQVAALLINSLPVEGIAADALAGLVHLAPEVVRSGLRQPIEYNLVETDGERVRATPFAQKAMKQFKIG